MARIKQLILLCALLPVIASAFYPILIEPTRSSDILAVENPETERTYYGELDGFPHTFEIGGIESFTLYTQVYEPDIEGSVQDHNVIVIKERASGRGVEEVVRLPAAEAGWEKYYEPAGGDSYLRGGEFEAEVGPGVYRIEVSTPRNEGKYALTIGQNKDADLGYFETLSRIYQVKLFFKKPGIAVLQSPLVYWPLLFFLVFGLGVYWYRKHYA